MSHRKVGIGMASDACFRPLLADDYKQNTTSSKMEKKHHILPVKARLAPESLNDITGYWIRYAMAGLLVNNKLLGDSCEPSLTKYVRRCLFGHSESSRQIEDSYAVNSGRLLVMMGSEKSKIPADCDTPSTESRQRIQDGLRYKVVQMNISNEQNPHPNTFLSSEVKGRLEKALMLMDKLMANSHCDNDILELRDMLPVMEPTVPLRLDLELVDFGDIFGEGRIPEAWRAHLESSIADLYKLQGFAVGSERSPTDPTGHKSPTSLRNLGDTVLFRSELPLLTREDETSPIQSIPPIPSNPPTPQTPHIVPIVPIVPIATIGPSPPTPEFLKELAARREVLLGARERLMVEKKAGEKAAEKAEKAAEKAKKVEKRVREEDIDPSWLPTSGQISVHLSSAKKDVCHIPMEVDGKHFNVLAVLVKSIKYVKKSSTYNLSGWYYKPEQATAPITDYQLTKKNGIDNMTHLSDRDMLICLLPDPDEISGFRLSGDQIELITEAIRKSQD